MKCKKNTSLDFCESEDGCHYSLGLRFNMREIESGPCRLHVHLWRPREDLCVTHRRALTAFKAAFPLVVSASWDWEPES